MNLPPEDSRLWDRMEDDIADERFPLPFVLPGLGFWYRGPRRELRRRAAFRSRLESRFKAAKPRPWWHDLLSAARAFVFVASLQLLRAPGYDFQPIHYGFFLLLTVLAVLLKIWSLRAFVRGFDRRASAYFGQPFDGGPPAALPVAS